MAHTFDADRAAALEDVSRFAYCSVDELLALFDPDPGDLVLDLGSGSGFYTDEVAPHAGRVIAADLQQAMGVRYRERGLPGNVDPVTAAAGSLPLPDGAVDAVVSTMTFHEAGDDVVDELARVLGPGGRLGIVDWTAAGDGDAGPPLVDRFDADGAVARLGDAFEIRRAEDRRETFVLSARAR